MGPATEAKVNGAQLLKSLAATGTSAAKLQPAAQVLAFIHRKESRIATAAELVAVLEKCGAVSPWEEWPPTPELTLRKARAIAAAGAWEGAVEVAEVPVWDKLLAGEELPDEAAAPAADAAAEAFDPKKPVADDAPHNKNPLLAHAAPCEEGTPLALAPAKKKAGRPAKPKSQAPAPA